MTIQMAHDVDYTRARERWVGSVSMLNPLGSLASHPEARSPSTSALQYGAGPATMPEPPQKRIIAQASQLAGNDKRLWATNLRRQSRSRPPRRARKPPARTRRSSRPWLPSKHPAPRSNLVPRPLSVRPDQSGGELPFMRRARDACSVALQPRAEALALVRRHFDEASDSVPGLVDCSIAAETRAASFRSKSTSSHEAGSPSGSR